MMVSCLDSIHSYFGVVVATDIKWSSIIHGGNPVSHFWVILHNIDSLQWQAFAVFYTLKNMWTCFFFKLKAACIRVGKKG